jgi:hypothetical protein
MVKELNWGTTPGMGDIMMALNCAYRWAAENKQHLELNLHWFHDDKHLHHFEEEETIIERTDYIRQLYLESNVTVNHIFNSDRKDLALSETRYDWFQPRSGRDANNWMFRPNVFLPTDENKVVLWRPTFNAEIPRYWKRTITKTEWDFIIYNLQNMGYNVVELCYRTPIREATYHINTCNFIVCYDGMWHYIAQNFFKPMIIASHDPITRYHTRQAVPYAKNKFTKYVSNIHTPVDMTVGRWKGRVLSPYDFMHLRANRHKEIFLKWYNGNR